MEFLVTRSTATDRCDMVSNTDIGDNEGSGDSTDSDIGIIANLDLNSKSLHVFSHSPTLSSVFSHSPTPTPSPTPSVGPESGMGYSIASDASVPDTVSSTAEDGSSSFGRKRQLRHGESSDRSTRPSHNSIGAELVEIGHKRHDIMEHLLQREMADRTVIYSIEQCLNKLHSLEGITRSQMPIVADVLGGAHRHTLLMTMTDDPLVKWIEKQELYAAMKVSRMDIYPLSHDFPGYST